jgi:hypothetical protein
MMQTCETWRSRLAGQIAAIDRGVTFQECDERACADVTQEYRADLQDRLDELDAVIRTWKVLDARL